MRWYKKCFKKVYIHLNICKLCLSGGTLACNRIKTVKSIIAEHYIRRASV